MEMGYFDEFLELAQIGSYTSAAKKQHISQSVLSKHMKAMEEELGSPLFVRSKHGVMLSECGRILLPYANRISRIRKEYCEAINSHRNAGGVLRIGSIPAVTQLGIGRLVAGFVKERPNITVNIKEGDGVGSVYGLQRRELDVAFVRGTVEAFSEMSCFPYMTDQVVAIMEKSHPFARRECIHIEDLKNEKGIIINKTAHVYRMLEPICREAGFSLDVVYSDNEGKRMVNMAAQGLGIVLVNRQTMENFIKEFPNLSMVPLDPPLKTTVYVYYQPETLSSLAEEFICYIREERGKAKEGDSDGNIVSEGFSDDGGI